MNCDYSIIIPAYNEEELLPRTIESVRQAMGDVTGLSGEIIVTDNNSEDRTAQIAEELGALVVFEPERQIARARNSGARVSHGRFLVFVDADTLISSELLSKALEALASGRFCGGGAQVSFDENLNISVVALLAFWRTASRVFKWAAGSYLFCLREAFEEVGGFDETYYASEEIHLSRALKKWGKAHGKKMAILREEVITSNRKAKWFTVWQVAGLMMRMAVKPSMLRKREGCWLWYDRPEKE